MRNRFAANCDRIGVPIHCLERRAIENYFTLDALREVFKAQIGDDVTKLDPRRDLKKQIGMNVKKRNRQVAEAMSIGDLEGTDLLSFLDSLAVNK